MPVIPIYTTDENGTPLNDLQLYIDDVLVDGDLDYGDTYDFPCGVPFKMNLRRTLWFGANELICHNSPTVSNNDANTIINGFSSYPFPCLIPANPHTPNSFITVNINGNIYTQNYNYYTPTVNQMLTDITTQINLDTPTTFWEAIVLGDCLRIRKTQYTANSFNGQIFTVTIHREFPAVMIQTNLGATGGTTADPCVPPGSIPDDDEYLWQITWREQHEDFTQTLIVDTDDDVPFEFENTLLLPCCQSWTVGNNDSDGILEAGELDPMFIILATPTFEGAISNFYLVKHPCQNLVCAYEMTNIPYCHYEYNYNVTPENKQDIIRHGRNTCYEYHCPDIYTVGLRVVRCTEELVQAMSHCGCGIDEVRDVNIIEDISYQQVEADRLHPDIFNVDIDRPAVCEQLCDDCNTYCKHYCYLEQDTFNILYVWDYLCCNGDINNPNTATIRIYDNNVLIQTVTLNSGSSHSFTYTWNTTGLHEIRAEVETCCGTFEYKWKYYIIPCKPYDLDFEWKVDCDCTVRGSNPQVRECDCVPVGEEVIFYPEYTVPDCGCPETCETIDPDPVTQDVFTEQTNGTQLNASAITASHLASVSYTPYTVFLLSDVFAPPPKPINIFPLSVMERLGNLGVGVRFMLGRHTGTPFNESLSLFYFFQNSYNLSAIISAKLSFNVWFRYQNMPSAPYPVWGSIPNFPFKFISPHAVDISGTPQPSVSAYNVTFTGIDSQFNGATTQPFVNPNAISISGNYPFTHINTPYYRFEIDFGAGSIDIDGIRLDMELDSAIFLANQYIVDILISDIDLIVTTQDDPYERCFKEYIVRWYVDDNEVKEVNMQSPNYNLTDDRLEYTFDNKGCYDVKLEVENCAGACSVEKQVCVGDPVTLTKLDCYEWVLTDCKRYKKCYDDPETDYLLTTPVNITELNIVTLPVNQEWVQLEPDTVYYDPRENKWFYYWQYPLAIILYQDLYNASLPHAVGIHILEYPYAVNLVTGQRYWLCEKYKVIVEVYDIKGNLVEGYPYEMLYYEGHNIHISVPKDGVYKVKFRVYSIRANRYPDTPPDPLTFQVIEELECEYEWYLIELCGIYKCYEALFHKLQCATDCECPDEKEIAKLRQELNLFMAFFNLLNISIEAEFSMYATMSSIIMDSQRIANANTIQEQLDALIKLCNKCGCACKTDTIKKPYCSQRILSQGISMKGGKTCCGGNK